ncbi:MAG: acetylglutamate kinase [bacterium]
MRIVLKLGGNVVLDPEQVRLVAAECRALRAAGHNVVIVHGGGPQIDQALASLGETVHKIDGLRVTSPAAAAVVLRVMDQIGAELSKQLATHGLATFHMPAAQRTFEAQVKKVPGGDLGRVGAVTRFAGAVAVLATPTHVPVVTPVGFDAAGALNVNADEGACAVAASIRCEWLVLATDVSAVRGSDGMTLSRLTPPQARALVGNAATGGMIPKLHGAVAAIEAGVARVLITRLSAGTLQNAVVHGRADGTLVEAGLAGP